MRFHCLWITLVFVLMGVEVSSAEALVADNHAIAPEIRREIASRLNRPLPDIEAIIPGYHSPSKNNVGLVIGNLDISSADEIPWGRAIGQILRWQLPYGPTLLLRSPHVEPDRFRSDLYMPGVDRNQIAVGLDAIVPAFRRLGLENGLTGKGQLDAAKFSLTFELYSFPDKGLKKTYSFEGTPAEFPKVFGNLSTNVLNDLGVQITDATRTYISQASPKSFEDLSWYAGIMKTADSIEAEALLDEIENKWKSGTDFPAMVPLLCYSINRALMEKGIDAGPKYQAILDRYPHHAGVANYIFRCWSNSGDGEAREKLLSVVSSVVKENPLDTTSLARLGETYLMGRGDPMEGLALILHSAEVFPRCYRTWWTVSICLRRARNVLFPGLEEQALLDFYNELDQISEACFARALKMFPDSPELLGIPPDQATQNVGRGSQAFPGSTSGQTQATTQKSPGAGMRWNRGLIAQDEKDPRIIIEALKESMDSPYSDSTLRLFWNASFCLDQADQDQMLDDETLFALAQELGAMAKDTFCFAVSGKMTGALKCLLRCGMKDLALKEAREVVKGYLDRNEFPSRERDELAEVAIYLGDGDLAAKCFESYKPMSTRSVPNFEDFLESLKAMVLSVQGKPDETKALLEKRIAESEDNLYSRLRYLEISLQQPVNETIKQECIKYLIGYAPMEIELKVRPRFGGGIQLPQGYAPMFYQAILRHIAEGHVARAVGDHVKALESYRQADALASKCSHILSLDLGFGESPHISHLLWDERRMLFSKGEIQPEVKQ